jgi:protein tyrosine/serine phosphatase
MNRVALRLLLSVALFSSLNGFNFSLCAQEPPSLSAQSPHGDKIQLSGIKNAGKINDHLYRGAQPASPAFAELKKLGITTVVDLRGNTKQADWERQQTESQGMRYLNLPVGGFSAPSDQQLVQFLSIFRGDPNEKVFVHCHYGEDRTGVFVASYRMALEKWPAAQALHEMYFFGFNGKWQPYMKRFVHGFPNRFATSPAYSEFKEEKHPTPAAQSPQD